MLELRFLTAFLIGTLMCSLGSLCYTVTHNRLSSPETLGISGISVCVALASFALTSWRGGSVLYWGVTITFAVMLVAYLFIGKTSSDSLILKGITFNILVGAAFGIFQFVAMSTGSQFPTHLWFGSLKFVELPFIYVLIPVFITYFGFLRKNKEKIECLNMPVDLARNLEIYDDDLRKHLILWTLLIQTLIVLCFGIFSFVGLVFVQIIRSSHYFSQNYSSELLYAPFIGGVLFTLIDIGCYYLPVYGGEIPTSMITTVFGTLLLLVSVNSDNKGLA